MFQYHSSWIFDVLMVNLFLFKKSISVDCGQGKTSYFLFQPYNLKHNEAESGVHSFLRNKMYFI